MLILVGVTINLATNGGLFEKSRTASKDTEQKKILEELIAMAEFDNDGKIDVNSLTEKVEAKYVGSKYEGTKLTVKGNKGEFYYKVTETEISLWKENTTPTAKITAENYGDKVAYSAGGVDDWKIFYKDDSYVYIITSDYLNNENLPTDLNMSKHGEYGANWDSEDNFTSTGASNIAEEVANKYGLNWLNSNASSTNPNARATADLLNVSAWTAKFGNESKGIEAIGAPTLEMWVKSWNAKSTLQLKTEYDSIGYYIGPTTTESLSEVASEDDDEKGGYDVTLESDINLYNEGSLYFPHISDYNNCFGYWLATPSAKRSRLL